MPNVNKVATKTVAQMSAAVARKKPLTAAMARGGLK